ncbi:MAG TPA: DUF2950 family protein [Steroidobacteraceae bacterium]|jgi:hypothetical protein|nr:DUF2950 family protein [Steroidobacteraceae bacterium]
MTHLSLRKPVRDLALAILLAAFIPAVLAQSSDTPSAADRGYADEGDLRSLGASPNAVSEVSSGAVNDVSAAAARGRASASAIVQDRSEANSKKKPESFKSPAAAADAFVEALRKGDRARLEAIFIDTHLISGGDDVADRAEWNRFVREYDRKHSLGGRDQGMVTLYVGESAWPFAVPIVKGDAGYYFNSTAGAQDVVFRRIGRNELRAIAVCSGYVAAQKEYALSAHDGQPAGTYARKLMSDDGKHNGLYWPAKADELRSPAGRALAAAEAEGYSTKTAGKSTPYHGYLFRPLTAQSRHARDGERNYLDESGRQVGGFALLAYPAEYGRSGVKSFIVNADGIVYEKDLGAQTADVASGMTEFDPQGWKVAL